MSLNQKHLTFDETNIDLWCREICVLWIFGKNIDFSFSYVNITSDP